MARVALTTTIPSTSGATQYELLDFGVNFVTNTVRATVVLYNADGRAVETFNTVGSANDFGLNPGTLTSLSAKAIARLKVLNRIN